MEQQVLRHVSFIGSDIIDDKRSCVANEKVPTNVHSYKATNLRKKTLTWKDKNKGMNRA